MSRNAMLQGLAGLPAASSALPFCRMFYGPRSQYLWTDQRGEAHVVEQAEGGEQGDPPVSYTHLRAHETGAYL
eukprot:1918225-Pyramimonas_sp.AAC.1